MDSARFSDSEVMALTSGAAASPTLTPAQAATRLAVSDSTVRRWLAEGRLEGVRVGGRYRIDPDVLEEMLAPANLDRRRDA